MTNVTILLVEDDPIISIATGKKLERYGYSVIAVNSGERAIAHTSATDTACIDLILMDIDLGSGINGVDTARTILKSVDIPVVFVSSHTETEIISLTQEITGYGYIVKASDIIVYNTAITMALKLFKEKIKNEIYARYITTALEKTSEPFFICNTAGDIEFFNKEYLKIQGLSSPEDVEKKYERYKEQILVFSEHGELLTDNQIASAKALQGQEGNEVLFYVYNKRLQMIFGNEYIYAPVYYKNNIVGSYVKIGKQIAASEALSTKMHKAIQSAIIAAPDLR